MSTRESILRYNLIIKKLQNKYASFEEIEDYLAFESELRGDDLNISLRSFQRCINNIRDLYGKDIRFDRHRRAYTLIEETDPDINNRMLDAFEMFNTLNVSDDLKKFIYFEKRRPQGIEHFYGLLHAIKNCFAVEFTYQKFWEDESSNRILDAFALKEFKGRWYLIGNDHKDGQIKSFGLDRILKLKITNQKFNTENDFNPDEFFKHCFGIINENSEPERIILSFNPLEGKYIKSYPLHGSQQILNDDADETRIELQVQITHDLVMELLSYGEALQIVSPSKLLHHMKDNLSNSLKYYEASGY